MGKTIIQWADRMIQVVWKFDSRGKLYFTLPWGQIVSDKAVRKFDTYRRGEPA